MKRKEVLREFLGGALPAAPVPVPAVPADRRVPSGAVRAMGLDLDALAEGARRAEELERQAASGQAVVELDPGLVDPSFAEDRIGRGSDPDFRHLVESIAAVGQQVPILVRPSRDAGGRYQIAYGHRRLAAAAELGRPVRAVVRQMSDAELVVAQGKENAERRNLSFIERAVFAAELDLRGFDRPTLCTALAAHSAEITRYLAVAKAVPRWLVRAIGPAPKAGRPRWLQLAELVAQTGSEAALRALVERADFRLASSDRRFEMTTAALRPARSVAAEDDTEVIAGPGGEAVLRIEKLASGTRMTVIEHSMPGLSAFLLQRLPDLLAEFQAGMGAGDTINPA